MATSDGSSCGNGSSGVGRNGMPSHPQFVLPLGQAVTRSVGLTHVVVVVVVLDTITIVNVVAHSRRWVWRGWWGHLYHLPTYYVSGGGHI